MTMLLGGSSRTAHRVGGVEADGEFVKGRPF
jgi:hypothetical protein